MRLRSNLLPITALIPIAYLILGCGDGPTEVQTGSLEVSTLSIGSAIDSDGYTVVLNSVQFRPIDVHDTLSVPEVSVGQYTVELTGLADNCGVVGANPVTVSVEGEQTTRIHFDVSCPPFQDHIAFDSDRAGDHPDIYIMNADGSNPINLTRSSAPDAWPAWSPDGMRIAFWSGRDRDGEIYVIDADGSNLVNLTNIPGHDGNPAWSPDGMQIAFESYRGGGDAEIYVMHSDGSNPVNITNHPASDREPAWSPDGARIAFISTRDPDTLGSGALFVMDADGSNLNWLIHDDCMYSPDWSPDGKRIAYRAQCSSQSNDTEIVVINADGSNQAVLTNHPGVDLEPAWSPDGTRIAFCSLRDGDFDIYVMNSDGSNQVALTEDPSHDERPAWSPGP